MKVIVTGSLGHVGKPLVKELIQKGHAVSVISSKPEKQQDIEASGATAAIGSLEDLGFLTAAFAGADAVFAMVPPNFGKSDNIAYYREIAGNYVKAIQQAGVKRVVHLSSYGADLDKGTGMILGSHHAEKILDGLPGVSITHLRPTYFYNNLYSFSGMIKGAGFIGANYGGDDMILLTHPTDIADVAAEELTAGSGEKVRYIASDERTATDIARTLGTAIGKPDLKWLILLNEQVQKGLEQNGVPAPIVPNLIDMGEATHNGTLRQDFDRHRPEHMGKIKLEDFAKDFAAVFSK